MNNIQKHLDELKDFQTSFNSTYNKTFTLQPKHIIDLRINMYDEEAEEFLKSFRLNDKIEILDAITDELFLLFGDIVTIGVGDKIAENYDDFKSEYFDQLLETLIGYEEFAPKMITLDSLSGTIGMLDYIEDNENFTDVDKLQLEEIAVRYFSHRLLLLDLKGYSLYGDSFSNILDESLTTVFNSNMSKLDDNKKPIINGENGYSDPNKPLGKILKSENYWTPTTKLVEILDKYDIK